MFTIDTNTTTHTSFETLIEETKTFAGKLTVGEAIEKLAVIGDVEITCGTSSLVSNATGISCTAIIPMFGKLTNAIEIGDGYVVVKMFDDKGLWQCDSYGNPEDFSEVMVDGYKVLSEMCASKQVPEDALIMMLDGAFNGVISAASDHVQSEMKNAT